MEAQMIDLLAPGSPSVSLKESSATSALSRLLHYQVLRQGRMTRAAALTAATSAGPQASANSAGSSGSRSGRAVTAAAHLMLNIQLTGFAANGEQLATNLTFVELAAPESKLGASAPNQGQIQPYNGGGPMGGRGRGASASGDEAGPAPSSDGGGGAAEELAREVEQLRAELGAEKRETQRVRAESSLLEAQVRALQDNLNSARAGQSSLSTQLSEAKAASETLRQERDRLQRQNHELSEKLQAQVRSLSEETSRLRAQALEAAGQVEAEQVARRSAESALAQLRVQMENSRGAEGSALQQAASLSAQVKELTAAIEVVRAERNKLQEAKWRAEERCEQLGLELDAALTQRTKLDMEARAASTKAASDLRSAVTAAEGLKVELNSTRQQVEALKHELRAVQQAAEDASRRESTAHTDMQEMESLMRELDRDLEVQVNAVWRQLRAERADSLFALPEAGTVAPARRWRPVLQALVSIMKRSANEAERQSQALEQARERAASLEGQVFRTNELATSLAAHQQLKAAHMSELEESRRSIALMDQALTEANRECERLHRQLEELSTTHKAFTAEAATRESRLQSQMAERESSLQAQIADREERLRAAMADHEKRLAALTAEWESRLQLQVAERDARFHSALADADAKLQAAAAERDARLAAAAADADAKLAAAIAERDARLQQTITEGEARYHEAVSDRDARVAALTADRDALQRQMSSLRDMQAEDKQERDLLRLRSSPVGGGVGSSLEIEGVIDWGEPLCQEKLLKSLAGVRIQVGKLQAELGPLRASAGLTEELSSQLGSARSRLADAQRSVEELSAKTAELEADLRGALQTKSSLQQQLTTSENEAAALQTSLTEARHIIASLQDDVAMLTKSRDTWKDAHGQIETLTARLTATDKALAEANTRAASLNGQLVLAESEARLKAQELMSRVQAAEDAEQLAKANAKDALERLENRLREAGEQGGRLVADLDNLRAERHEAQLKADDLQRQLMEARARLVDAEHVSKQLQKVIAERDSLQEQMNGLRNTHMQANDDLRSLRRQLEMAQEQLTRVQDEKTRLAAQVEGQRLDAIMNSMAPRTSGRLVALARPGGVLGGEPGQAPGGSMGLGGTGDGSQRPAPSSYVR
ncbi:hypothetical protein GPECTOR_1g173 [Gonium pectorale]|uniref:Uncharacterized protein n=1 Tax=Gonium pectorale TaxID=33097 RepID=A0A150H3Q9_GONPE|nr:hypothetical protein GPECTOR_1g173 [Gonium pectorale]|eukprot:KXZ56200.1 hypothetical protein GPECTOR_1g173 [Gonium pectorale]